MFSLALLSFLARTTANRDHGAAFGVSATAPAATADPLPAWQNHSVPTAARVADLIQRLTVDEKAALLQHNSAAVPRLGLPSYEWGRECERGDASGPAGTAYPTPLALAAAFDVRMVDEVARATALEVRGNVNAAAGGGGTFGASCFGPVSNLIRDSRWGRTAEMIGGEDPVLGRVMSRAFTWGMQAPPLRGSHGDAEDDAGYRMLVTIAKHLNAYTGPEGWGFTFGCACAGLVASWGAVPWRVALLFTPDRRGCMARQSAFWGTL
jgi:beta-glucosidase